MVFGVSIFSYCLGEIIEMMFQFNQLYFVDFDQDEELDMFFGLLIRFNNYDS